MIIFFSIIIGILVSVMIQINGILQIHTGGVRALVYIHISGILLTIILLTLLGRKFSETQKAVPFRQAAGWKKRIMLLAGILGIPAVFLSSASFAHGGILVALSGSLAGQTLAASLYESLAGRNGIKAPALQRITAPALLIPGAVIIAVRAGTAPLWILIAWTPGIILMIQQMINAGNTNLWGTPVTVLFNYLSALALLIPLSILTSDAGKLLPLPLEQVPLYIIAGGGMIGVITTGGIAWLLAKAPALTVVLGIYAGELGGGMALDIINGNNVEPEKIIGLFLVAAGLLAGKVTPGRTAVPERRGL